MNQTTRGRRNQAGRAALILAVLMSAGFPAGADPSPENLAENARAKLDAIKDEQAPPGSTIAFPLDEIGAWSAAEAPNGITDPVVKLNRGVVELHGMIDFLEIAGEEDSLATSLFAPLLRGKRPIDVIARVASAPGFVLVTLDEVRLSGIALSETLRDFIINTFLVPHFPVARFDEPVPLKLGMDLIQVEPSGITVIMKGAP